MEREQLHAVELKTLPDEQLTIHLYKQQALLRLCKTELQQVIQTTLQKSKSSSRSFRRLHRNSSATSLNKESEIELQLHATGAPVRTTDPAALQAQFLLPLETRITDTKAEIALREQRFRELTHARVSRQIVRSRFSWYILM